MDTTVDIDAFRQRYCQPEALSTAESVQAQVSAVQGINHLALVCANLYKTTEFYTQILGFPLKKVIEIPRMPKRKKYNRDGDGDGDGDGNNNRQDDKFDYHIFFDIGNHNCLAFFNNFANRGYTWITFINLSSL